MIILFLFCSFLFSGEIVSPKLGYCVHDQYLKKLKCIFPSLTKEEKKTNWGKEYEIAKYFAKELDLYQAITAFKRASIMIDETLLQRKREIDYQIINCYYLGGKYEALIDFFDRSLLANIEDTFPAFKDLLIILYDAYSIKKEEEKKIRIEKIMDQYYPIDKKKLAITYQLLEGNIDAMKKTVKDSYIDTAIASVEASLDNAFYDEQNGIASINRNTQANLENQLLHLNHLKQCQLTTKDIYDQYNKKKKNPLLASSFNAIVPGMGYLYLGQKQSALTAFLLNLTTTSAAYYFYTQNNIFAAILTLSFESGWYLGGIYGALEEANFYNKRCFENAAHFRMRDNKLYPILMLRHGF